MSSRFFMNVRKLKDSPFILKNINVYRCITESYATTVRFSGGVALTGHRTLVKHAHIRLFSNLSSMPNLRKEIAPERLFEQIETYYKQYGFINYQQFTKFVDILEKATEYDTSVNLKNLKFLLGACGEFLPSQTSEERLILFQRLWTYLVSHNQISKDMYNIKMQVLKENHAEIPEFESFLNEIELIQPNDNLFTELLEVTCMSGNIHNASIILTRMKNNNLPLSERHFNALILGHGRNKDLTKSQSLLESMSAAGIVPSLDTQTNLILAYLENGRKEEAINIIQKYTNQFTANQILSILRITLHLPEVDESIITQLINELSKEFTMSGEIPVTLQNICIELVNRNQLSTVINIISSLTKPQYNDKQDIDKFGVFLLSELFKVNTNYNKIIEIAYILMNSEKNMRALHVATEIALRKKPELGMHFLEVLAKEENLRAHYFWPLILYEKRENGENGVMNVLKDMTRLQTTCTEDTLLKYVLPNIPIMLENPVQLMKILNDIGLLSSQLLPCIIKKLIIDQKDDKIIQLLELYPTKLNLSIFVHTLCNLSVTARAKKNLQQFTQLVSVLARRNINPNADFAGELLLEMLARQSRLRSNIGSMKYLLNQFKKFNVGISSQAAESIKSSLRPAEGNKLDEENMNTIAIILKTISRKSLNLSTIPVEINSNFISNSTNSSTFIKHPRDMSIDELEYHLIELESKNLNTRGVLRRLLQLCVRDSRLERAIEIKRKCDELHVHTSAGMFASIFDLYIKLKDIGNAAKTLENLKKTFPGFSIDEHKIIDYAALMVYERRLDDAKTLLENRSKTERICGGDYVIKNIWNFLTNVASLAAEQNNLIPMDKNENLTRDAYIFLKKNGYCKGHNAVLGPIIREYLWRGDLKMAVEEFEVLAERYKHTPLQFELLTLLVRLSNGNEEELKKYSITAKDAQEMLTKITGVIEKIHGRVNMNSAFLLAFAESGTENQLRSLMLNPEFRINQEQLQKNCEHLNEEGAVNTLLRLARGARGFSRVVNEQSIYNMILDRFVNENNYTAALELYDQLCADDELKITQEFLKKLVNILKMNNMDIPSNIALRAHAI